MGSIRICFQKYAKRKFIHKAFHTSYQVIIHICIEYINFMNNQLHGQLKLLDSQHSSPISTLAPSPVFTLALKPRSYTGPKPTSHTGPQAHFLLASKPSFHTSPQAQFSHWPLNPLSTLAPKPSFFWPHNFFLASKPSFPCSQIKIKEK